MAIWKRKMMQPGEKKIIVPQRMDEEATPGQFGPQDKWWVKIDNDNATIYTGYFPGGTDPDWLGMAFRQSIQRGNCAVLIEKFYDPDSGKNTYKYSLASADGQTWEPLQRQRPQGNAGPSLPASPAPSSVPSQPAPVASRIAQEPQQAPPPPPPPKRDPFSSQGNLGANMPLSGIAKERSIIIQAMIKAAAEVMHPGCKPAEVFSFAQDLAKFTYDYATDDAVIEPDPVEEEWGEGKATEAPPVPPPAPAGPAYTLEDEPERELPF